MADEPAVTVLTGFEDNSVAVRIATTKNVRSSDCTIEPAGIPARTGQRSIKLEVGATVADAEVGCSLLFRTETPFNQADRIAAYVCLYEGAVGVALRLRDDRGRLFETPYQQVTQHAQFVRVAADLNDRTLKPVEGGNATPAWPLQVAGFAVRTPNIGRQTLYLDDIEVEHRVKPADLVRGEFLFDQPTHLYEPGSSVTATARLENRSRERALRLDVELALLDSTGHRLASETTKLNLPRSGVDYRSFQDVELRQRIAEPGLYRIVGTVREARWPRAATFESSVATLPSNRALPRGRANFFGIRTNLLREALDGQDLEIALAREIGAQLLAVDVAWAELEPVRDEFRFAPAERLLRKLHDLDIATCLVLHTLPDWLPADQASRLERQGLLIEALSKEFGLRLDFVQACPLGDDNAADIARRLQEYLTQSGSRVTVLASEVALAAGFQNAGGVREVLEISPDGRWLPPFRRNVRDAGSEDRLLVRSRPLLNSGALGDAVDVLETLVAVAETGLEGVLWFDLRDDTVDSSYPGAMRGLVARDFSPKMPLVGYASAVGMLHGLRYVGPLENAPDDFASALFMGAERQVAILIPRPNRPLPGLLAPITGAAGRVESLDFERRKRSLIGGQQTPQLVETLDRPMFLAFTAERALKDPALSFAADPWLQIPRTVLCGATGSFTVKMNAPFDLSRGRSRIQLVVPREAPVESSLSSRRLSADAGDEVEIPVELTRTGDDPWFEPFVATVRLTVEGERLEVPLRVEPIATVAATDTELARMSNGEDDSRAPISAAWSGDKVVFSFGRPSDLNDGATLRVFVVAEGERSGPPLEIAAPWSKPAESAALPAGWQVTRGKGADSPCIVTITPEALDVEKLGERIRLACELIEPAGLFPGRTWRLGRTDDPVWLTK